jgi:BCD family chlorophyll transporter-like MFS transporter
MFAYNMQDLILEPFAGAAFGFTVGESTRLTSEQHSGALIGMILVGILASRFGKGRATALKKWTIAGCIASGAALLGLALASLYTDTWPLRLNVVLMGVATGGFTVAASSSMMGLANVGASNREGIRMGVWGAAQAIAFASGSFVGTLAADASRLILDDRAGAYGLVFTIEGVLFLVAAALATRIGTSTAATAAAGTADATAAGDTGAQPAPVLSAAAEQQLGSG